MPTEISLEGDKLKEQAKILQIEFTTLFKFLDITFLQSVLKAQENDQWLHFVLWKRNRAVQERQVCESLCESNLSLSTTCTCNI